MYMCVCVCVCVLNSDIVLFSTVIFRLFQSSSVSKIWKEDNIIFRRLGDCICRFMRQMCEGTYSVQSVQ